MGVVPVSISNSGSYRMKVGNGFAFREPVPQENPNSEVKSGHTDWANDVEQSCVKAEAEGGFKVKLGLESERQDSPKRQRATHVQTNQTDQENLDETWRQGSAGGMRIKVPATRGFGEAPAAGMANGFCSKSVPNRGSSAQVSDEPMVKKPRVLRNCFDNPANQEFRNNLFSPKVDSPQLIVIDSDDEGNNTAEASGMGPDKREDSSRLHVRRQESRAHVEDVTSDSDDDVQILESVEIRSGSRGRVGSAPTPKGKENEDDDVVCDDRVQGEVRQKWEEAARQKQQQRSPMGFTGVGSSPIEARCGNTAAAVETQNEEKPDSCPKRPGMDYAAGNANRAEFFSRGKESQVRSHEAGMMYEECLTKDSASVASGQNDKASGSHESVSGDFQKVVRGSDTSQVLGGVAVSDRVVAKSPQHKDTGLEGNGGVVEEPTFGYQEALHPHLQGNAAKNSPMKHQFTLSRSEISGAGTELVGTGKNLLSDLGMEELGNQLMDQKERLKESQDYKRADEEEWRRREAELKRQALEVQRLKRLKKAEEDRKVEMQARQRQRLEDVRTHLQQEESKIGLKDQLRGKISSQLEQLAAKCLDMATLLKKLGIAIEGGNSATPAQVLAAYKSAMIKFHPDHATNHAKGNVRLQVEYEEAFKIIRRLKSTLPLVYAPQY